MSHPPLQRPSAPRRGGRRALPFRRRSAAGKGAIPPWLPVVLGLAAGCGSSPEEEPTPQSLYAVEASLSTNRIRIGETILLTAQVVHPRDADVEWPEWKRPRELAPRSSQMDVEPLSEQVARSTVRLEFTSFRVGSHLVSTNTVRIQTAEGGVEERLFPFLTYDVTSVLTNESPTVDAALQPEYDLTQWPGRFPSWLLTVAFALAGVAAAAAGIAWLVRRRLRPAPPPPRPPPHDIALAALRRLKRKRYIEDGRIEPFYVEVSAITRLYLEERFAIHAPERTTEEFMREAAQSDSLSPAHRQACRAFLEQCDLVKFARHQPEPSDMENAWEAAVGLVEETRPPPAEAAS